MRICEKVLLLFLVLTPAPLVAATILHEDFGSDIDPCQIPADWVVQDLLELEHEEVVPVAGNGELMKGLR